MKNFLLVCSRNYKNEGFGYAAHGFYCMANKQIYICFHSYYIKHRRIRLSRPVQEILGPPEMSCLQSWEAALIADWYEFSADQGHHVRRVFS